MALGADVADLLEFDGVIYQCPNCQWQVTMTHAVKWEMRKIDKVMAKHIHWCKGEKRG